MSDLGDLAMTDGSWISLFVRTTSWLCPCMRNWTTVCTDTFSSTTPTVMMPMVCMSEYKSDVLDMRKAFPKDVEKKTLIKPYSGPIHYTKIHSTL